MSHGYKQKNAPPEFRDPLENYEPKVHADPLERALAEEPVTAIQAKPWTAVSPGTSVRAAMETLRKEDIACVLVAEGDTLRGIFTARDVLEKVGKDYPYFKDRPVREVMSAQPLCVYETDRAAKALCVMAICGHRHVPILDVKGKIAGVVSPMRVIEFLRERAGT